MIKRIVIFFYSSIRYTALIAVLFILFFSILFFNASAKLEREAVVFKAFVDSVSATAGSSKDNNSKSYEEYTGVTIFSKAILDDEYEISQADFDRVHGVNDDLKHYRWLIPFLRQNKNLTLLNLESLDKSKFKPDLVHHDPEGAVTLAIVEEFDPKKNLTIRWGPYFTEVSLDSLSRTRWFSIPDAPPDYFNLSVIDGKIFIRALIRDLNDFVIGGVRSNFILWNRQQSGFIGFDNHGFEVMDAGRNVNFSMDVKGNVITLKGYYRKPSGHVVLFKDGSIKNLPSYITPAEFQLDAFTFNIINMFIYRGNPNIMSGVISFGERNFQ